MATHTNASVTYDLGRVIPEDLSDVIELIAQEDTPYTANIGKGKAKQTYHEWNMDSLADADEDNALIEGSDIAIENRAETTRIGNYTQIMWKAPGVTGTLQAIDIVGGKRALARELMKCGRELKLDREKRLVGVKPAVPGSTSAARQMAGFGAFIKTNEDRASGGADPTLSGGAGLYEGYPNAAPTDAGTTRVFTEALLKSVMAECYTSGGKPRILMVPPAQKVVVSTFPGIAPNRYDVGGVVPGKIIGTADVYLSDFGKLAIIPNPQMRTRDAWLVDPEQAELMTLRPVQTSELAKVGDSERRMMIWEGTHKVNNEKAHGAIADLT